MKLIFTKGAGKTDHLRVERPDGPAYEIECPKQRIIPHEMVHFAVESLLTARGFLSHLAIDQAPSPATQQESDGVERLVEVLQGDAWSGGNASPADMLDLYHVTCEARGCPALPIGPEDLQLLRERLRELSERWHPLLVGDCLTLRL